MKSSIPVCLPVLSALVLFSSCVKENGAVESGDGAADVKIVRLSDDVVQDAVLVKFSSAPGGEQLSSLSASEGVTLRRVFTSTPGKEELEARFGLDRWYEAALPEGVDIHRSVRSLAARRDVTLVQYQSVGSRESDGVSYGVSSPSVKGVSASFNDPLLSDQWHYQNFGNRAVSPTAVKGADINVTDVWSQLTCGDPSIVVAVVDEGVKYSHPDLRDNMWVNAGEIPGNGIDDDQNGYIDDVYGYNFVDGGPITWDKDGDVGHGTHCAGTIAAVNNNGKGVCGIAGGDYANGQPGVKLMSCQIFKEDEDGGGRGATAIKWGADHGAVISQNSWGYTTLNYVPKSDIAAIDYFNTYAGFDEYGNQVGPMAGGIVIFAAGNENSNFGAPGAYEGAIAVGSLGPDFYRAYYSNYGEWVDVAAPGGDYQKGHQILSTLPDNKYGVMQGTSMACPHVSGVAALIVSKCGGPGFTRSMLWNRLVNTTRDISKQNRNTPVGGLVDVLAAITAEGGVPPEPVDDFSVTPLQADFIGFSLTVPKDEDDQKAYGINIYYSTEPFSETTLIPYKSFPIENLKAGDKMEGVLSGLEFQTTYYLACEAYDRIGNRSALSNLTVVTTGKNHAPTVETDDPLNFTLKSHESRWLEFRYAEPDGHGIHTRLDKGSPADSLQQMQNLTQKIEINALRATPGTYLATLRVFDDYEMETNCSYTYTILPNHAPKAVGSIDDMVFGAKGEVQTASLTDVFRDEDGETLVYTTASSDNDILNLHVREGVLYVTALKYGYGSGTVTATDARGEKVQVTFQTLARDGSKAVDIYPTTITDGKLYVRTSTDQSVSAQVFSESGTVVLEKSQTATPFAPAILDLSNLGGGPYAVKVTVGGESFTQNIVLL